MSPSGSVAVNVATGSVLFSGCKIVEELCAPTGIAVASSTAKARRARRPAPVVIFNPVLIAFFSKRDLVD